MRPSNTSVAREVGPAGIEPTTSTVKSRRSVQFVSQSEMREIASLAEHAARKTRAAS